MSIKDLRENTQVAIKECLNAIANGQWLTLDCYTRTGLTQDKIGSVLDRFPNLEDSNKDSEDFLAVNNCLNEVCHGFLIKSGEWNKWFSISHDEIKSAYNEWTVSVGLEGTGIRQSSN